MTTFGRYHCYTDSRYYFHQRLEIVWKKLLQAFLEELPEVSPTCGLFSSDFSVKFIPRQFNGI